MGGSILVGAAANAAGPPVHSPADGPGPPLGPGDVLGRRVRPRSASTFRGPVAPVG
ncbi:hypothetical protein SFR_5257 [Streptomyces sp. FR-008]|nr:hypothetical protein SFR_5257 [Streptomyces sp. FR-008]